MTEFVKALINFILSLLSRKPKVDEPAAMAAPKSAPPATTAAVQRTIPFTQFADMGPIRDFFSQWQVKLPVERRVRICSAYGCRTQHEVTLSADTVAELRRMHKEKVVDGQTERHFLKRAIALLESATAKAAGVQNDRPSLDFSGSGDPGQLDCVDEATNTTSFLLFLGTYGMIQHHKVKAPIWKGGFTRWTHYAALITHTKTGVDYAIDSGVGRTGQEPLIIEETKFYV